MTDHDAARARQAAQAWPDSALGRSANPWPDRIIEAVPENLPELDRSWITQGACKGTATGVFYPERGESTLGPQAICRTCPVRVECLDYAMRGREAWGIWGGTTENQRRRLRVSIAAGHVTYDEVLEAHRDHDGIDHGTPMGYRAHLRRNVPPCDPCRASWRAYQNRHKRTEAS
jgi:WhiB family redox-sensing transcriptional regulator